MSDRPTTWQEAEAASDRIWNRVELTGHLMAPVEQRRLKDEALKLGSIAIRLKQSEQEAAYAFVYGALSALMNDDERAVAHTGDAITPRSDSTDDLCDASFRRGAWVRIAQRATYQRLKTQAERTVELSEAA